MNIKIVGKGGIDNEKIWRGDKEIVSLHEDDINLNEVIRNELSNFNLRRLDLLTKMYLVVVKEAILDANIKDMNGVGIITAMKYGPLDSVGNMIEKIFKSNFKDMAPLIFPQTTFNHVAGQICIKYGIHDFSNSLISSNNVDLKALEMAKVMLDTHQLSSVIVAAGDYINSKSSNIINVRDVSKSISSVILQKSDSNNIKLDNFNINNIETSKARAENLSASIIMCK